MIQIIQKITIYITILVSLFFGYHPNNVIATVNNTVTTQTKEIYVTIKNETNRIVTQSGVAITSIEKNIDGDWKTIGKVDDIPETAYIFYPTVDQHHIISLKDSFNIDSLSVCEYRLVVPYTIDGMRTSYAYFSVTE